MLFEQANQLKNNLNTNIFPNILPSYPATILSTLYQLEQSQWWKTEQILEKQFQQLQKVVIHAYNTIPFYQKRLNQIKLNPDQSITLEKWQQIPLLLRQDFQGKEEQFLTKSLPKEHGKIGEVKTSGSTAQPIKVYTTELTQFFWNIFTLRDHYWQKRDFRKKLVSIRYVKGDQGQYPQGITLENWGNPAEILYHTGKASILDIKKSEVRDQLEWLIRQNPEYFLTYPSNALELAKLTLEKGLKFPSLIEVRLMGEVVDQEVRNACKEAWNVPITDMYSANEVGYIALQCPEFEHYHIQSENLFVEVLNEQNQPCKTGEVGKIVLTTLHNFAMPLIRYQIGDYAEVGESCPCGRGLPVLKRILGRTRNMLVFPTGEKFWFPGVWGKMKNIVPFQQYQIIQKSDYSLLIRLVIERKVTVEEEAQITESVNKILGYPFKIKFDYPTKIERSAGGKFEEFMSEIKS